MKAKADVLHGPLYSPGDRVVLANGMTVTLGATGTGSWSGKRYYRARLPYGVWMKHPVYEEDIRRAVKRRKR